MLVTGPPKQWKVDHSFHVLATTELGRIASIHSYCCQHKNTYLILFYFVHSGKKLNLTGEVSLGLEGGLTR